MKNKKPLKLMGKYFTFCVFSALFTGAFFVSAESSPRFEVGESTLRSFQSASLLMFDYNGVSQKKFDEKIYYYDVLQRSNITIDAVFEDSNYYKYDMYLYDEGMTKFNGNHYHIVLARDISGATNLRIEKEVGPGRYYIVVRSGSAGSGAGKTFKIRANQEPLPLGSDIITDDDFKNKYSAILWESEYIPFLEEGNIPFKDKAVYYTNVVAQKDRSYLGKFIFENKEYYQDNKKFDSISRILYLFDLDAIDEVRKLTDVLEKFCDEIAKKMDEKNKTEVKIEYALSTINAASVVISFSGFIGEVVSVTLKVSTAIASFFLIKPGVYTLSDIISISGWAGYLMGKCDTLIEQESNDIFLAIFERFTLTKKIGTYGRSDEYAIKFYIDKNQTTTAPQTILPIQPYNSNFSGTFYALMKGEEFEDIYGFPYCSHDFIIESKNESQHKLVCTSCNYKITQDHSKTTVPHGASCDECGHIRYAHTYIYVSLDYEYHIKACNSCGYYIQVPHNFYYEKIFAPGITIPSLRHTKKCYYCDFVITEYHNSEIICCFGDNRIIWG